MPYTWELDEGNGAEVSDLVTINRHLAHVWELVAEDNDVRLAEELRARRILWRENDLVFDGFEDGVLEELHGSTGDREEEDALRLVERVRDVIAFAGREELDFVGAFSNEVTGEPGLAFAAFAIDDEANGTVVGGSIKGGLEGGLPRPEISNGERWEGAYVTAVGFDCASVTDPMSRMLVGEFAGGRGAAFVLVDGEGEVAYVVELRGTHFLGRGKYTSFGILAVLLAVGGGLGWGTGCAFDMSSATQESTDARERGTSVEEDVSL